MKEERLKKKNKAVLSMNESQFERFNERKGENQSNAAFLWKIFKVYEKIQKAKDAEVQKEE